MDRHHAGRGILIAAMGGQPTMWFLGLACLCAESTATQAWTSATGPLCDAIHQIAIDNVLGPKAGVPNAQMNDSDRNVLKNQQALADKDQAPEQSEEHAMTGITEEAPDVVKQKPVYIAKSEQLVRVALLTARTQRKENNTKVALPALGQAIHALQDSTSPAHRGFQIWSYQFGIWEMAKHVLKERVYPDDKLPDRYESHLEGAVQYAYDIYMGKEPLPPRFFDPVSGNLILPPSYLRTY